MAGAEPETEDGGGGGGRARPGRSGSAARVAPLGPEQLRQVLEQVTKAPPPVVLQDAVRRLRDAAQQAAPPRGPGAPPPPPPQPLEVICVEVTPREKKGRERPVTPLATIQPRIARLSPPAGRPCSVLGLSAPSPLLGAQPLLSAWPQLRILSSSLQPPVQVFVQRPLPTRRPVPVKRVVAPQAPNGPGTALAPQSASDPPAVTSVSSSSANFLVSTLRTKHTEKLKRSLKVKTRSGRISRPPKYKAKDYKFIKMEDLADSHLSGSDDYSELSVEEEEEQRGKQVLFDPPSCSLRPRSFQCRACEKSYIGKGGLARHFKLHPGHGRPEPEPEPVLSEKAHASLGRGHAEGRTAGPTSSGLSTPALLSEEGDQSAHGGMQSGQSVAAEEALVSEPADGSDSALLGAGRHPGPRRGCSTAPAGPSAAIPERSRASLREFLHQCDREDLVELALPQLAQVVTVYEFLLMKVERVHQAKPFFPAVYKEFEELHKMVKKMCHDHLHSSGLCSGEPLEISNSEVAESLGITEFLRQREAPADGMLHTGPGQAVAGEELEAASPGKRKNETTEEGLASVKRTRREALPEEAPEPSAPSGDQQEPAWRAPAASEGFASGVTGDTPHCPEEGGVMPVSDSDTGRPQAGLQPRARAELAARTRSADPAAPLPWDVSGPRSCSQLGQLRMLTREQVAALPTENAQGHSPDPNAGDSLGSRGPCSSLMPEGGVASQLPGGSGNATTKEAVGELSQVPGSHVQGQQPRSGEAPPPGAATLPLEKGLSLHLTLMPCGSTVCQPGPQLSQDGSLSTEGGLGSLAGDLDQFRCWTGTHNDQRELESIVAVGEAVAFEIASGCPELSQVPEQICIQASEGLILSHPGSIVSREEDILVLTEAEGPALQGSL
ncbi:zinc finger protein 839 [Rhynchonycteris naso]